MVFWVIVTDWATRPLAQTTKIPASASVLVFICGQVHVGRSENALHLLENGGLSLYCIAHFEPSVRLYPKKVVALDGFNDAVAWFFGFGDKGAEYSVPNDEDAGVVAVEIPVVHAVVDAVVRGCIQDPLERAEALDELGVDPKLIDQVESVHHNEHPRSEAHEH